MWRWRSLWLVLALSYPFRAWAETPAIQVRVDPRIELAAIMCRLAGFDEYQSPGIPAYDAAVEAHFRRFEHHPSIVLLRQLRRQHGAGYSATVSITLMARPGTWQARVPLASWGKSSREDVWADPDNARRFLSAAARFERDTQARAFFARQRALYRQVEDDIRDGVARQLDLAWFEREFGTRRKASFVLVPGLLNGPNSYGPHVELPDGGVEIYSVLGTPAFKPDEPLAFPLQQMRSLLVHELGHAYLNPWVDRHAERLQADGERLYSAVSREMAGQAYGDWRIMLYESLVRANTLHYFADHGLGKPWRDALADDRSKSFWWTEQLAGQLALDDQAVAPRFDTAQARVFAFFRDWAAEPEVRIAAVQGRVREEETARLRQGPQILRLVPAHDAVDVDTMLKSIEIHFDRPMDGGMAIFGGRVPDVSGEPAWDAERTVLRIPVKLLRDTRYEMQLNNDESAGFRSVDREPLAPRTWSFDTR